MRPSVLVTETALVPVGMWSTYTTLDTSDRSSLIAADRSTSARLDNTTTGSELQYPHWARAPCGRSGPRQSTTVIASAAGSVILQCRDAMLHPLFVDAIMCRISR